MKKYIVSAIVMVLAASLLMLHASATTVKKGDVNRDDKITASDARTVLRYSASLEKYDDSEIIICDVNNDNKISAADARLILRCSAKLESEFGTVELDNAAQGEKTELINNFTLSVEKFINKQGGEFKSSTLESGATAYEGNGVTVVSDPKMIASGKISSIIISSDAFSLDGVYPGMDKADAVSVLASNGWTEKENNNVSVVMSKVGMFMNITVKDGKATAIEYTLAESLVEDNKTDPEPTTTPDEPTTTPDDPTPVLPDNAVAYDDLPEQIKVFMSGAFGFNGYTYSEGKRDSLTFFTNGTDINAGMSFNMDEKTVYDIHIMMLGNGKKRTVYLCCDNTKKYHKMTDLEMKTLNLSLDEMELDFGSINPNDVVMTKSTVTEGDTEYIVYAMEGDDAKSDIYTVNGEIKRVLAYDKNGTLASQMDIEEFFTEIPADAFSVKKYSNSITVMGIFGLTDLLF